MAKITKCTVKFYIFGQNYGNYHALLSPFEDGGMFYWHQVDNKSLFFVLGHEFLSHNVYTISEKLAMYPSLAKI